MIILDTNVVSEVMKPAASPIVTEWLNAQVAETIYLSSVTLAAILFGISVLPAGRRKQTLAATVEGLIEAFEDRVLPFDAAAARTYAAVAATARMSGKGFPLPDGYIAAIAANHGYFVATRDGAPFVAAGVAVIDPWADRQSSP